MTKEERKDLESIESSLTFKTYNEIPQKFINLVEEKFSTYSYLKCVIEMKKQEL